MNKKIIAGGAAALLAVGLGVAAVGSTSAYFSDTNSGGYVAASLGSIKVLTDGEKFTPVIDFGSMLPGDKVEGGFTVLNNGRSTQDVYVTFPTEWQRDLINTLGKKAQVEVIVTDSKGQVIKHHIFDNLVEHPEWGNPVPAEVDLAEGLAAGDSIDVEFVLTMTSDWGNTWNVNVPFEWLIPTLTMDYNVVATQPGIAPGA